jgi:hypothetical protein
MIAFFRRAVLFSVLSLPLAAQGDPAVIEKIIVEGKERSQVWKTLDFLSDEIGTRLTGSTRLARANEWTRGEFARLGLSNAHLQQWGTVPVGFDRGPSRARMLLPEEREFEFTSASWSAGTNGPVKARVWKLPETMEELEAIGFEFAGCWVLYPARARGGPRGDSPAERAEQARRQEIEVALDELGIAGRIRSAAGELVLTDARRGWRELTIEHLPKDVSLEVRKSDHDVMAAALDAFEEVVVEVDLAHTFVPGPIPCWNTIAEIRGTERPDEVVIFSGHLDSWDGPGSKGTQDNGTGCAVMLEAARLLMVAGAQPKRTIRFALWTGEEQGLFGSNGYVASLSEEERAGISACFVDDGGTNYQGGVVCLATQKDVLDRAMAPVMAAFPELPMENSVAEHLPAFGASDHASFNAVNIPGYFWNETGSGGREGKNYEFVHHTQHDTQRYAVPEYLVQSAVCSAVTAYNLACADELLARDTPRADKKPPEPDPSFEVVAGPLSGNWKVKFVGDGAPDLTVRLMLEHAKDGRLRGSTSAMGSTSWFTDGKWDEASAKGSFEVMTDFGKIPYALRREGEALAGTLQAMGNVVELLGEREGGS